MLVKEFEEILKAPHGHNENAGNPRTASNFFGNSRVTGGSMEEVYDKVHPKLEALRKIVTYKLKDALLTFASMEYPYSCC